MEPRPEKTRDNADGSKTVYLDRAIVTHTGHVAEVVLRAPTYDDFMALGDPTAVILSVGSAVQQDDMGLLRAYVERLSSVPPELLSQIKSLADAMALVGAVKDFFRVASARISTPLPTPSSSASAGPSAMSAG